MISMGASRKLTDIMKALVGNGLVPASDIDKLIAQVEVIELEGKKYVIKKFAKEVGVVKWIPPTVFFRVNYPFTLVPKERFDREVRFFEQEWTCFRTPKLYEKDPKNLIIVREFIDGKPATYSHHSKKLGKFFAILHTHDWSLGDTKPTNFLVTEDGILYIIDAEQAIPTDKDIHKAWDLMLSSFFIAYRFLSNPDRYLEVLSEFINSYLHEGGKLEVIEELTTAKFSGLAILMPLPHVLIMSDVLEDVLRK